MKLFLAASAMVFLYGSWFATAVRDPGRQIKAFFGVEKDLDNPFRDFPRPPSLNALQNVPDEADRPKIQEATDLLDQGRETRRAGRLLWPLAAKYSVLRPSISDRYLMAAKGSLAAEKPWKARELGLMAIAFDERNFRAYELLQSCAKRLDRPKESQHYSQLITESLPKKWRPPAPDVDSSVLIGLLIFLFAIVTGFPVFYEHVLVRIAFFKSIGDLVFRALSHQSSSTEGGADLDEEPTTIQNLDQLALAREKTSKSISSILNAEAVLGDIQKTFDQKEYERGVDLCAHAVKLNPANDTKVAAICLAEGIRLFEIGDYDNSKELLEVSVHFDPHILEAHTCLGNCFIKLGDFHRAKSSYERVIEVDPKNGSAYYTLGVCYQKVNDTERAKRSFQVAVQLDNSHANSHFYLAKLYESEKNYSHAILHWTRFIELNPNSPHAAAAQDRLTKLSQLAGAQSLAPPPPSSPGASHPGSLAPPPPSSAPTPPGSTAPPPATSPGASAAPSAPGSIPGTAPGQVQDPGGSKPGSQG